MIAGIELPPGLVIDHVRDRGCKYRDCVRLDHLELVTLVENTLRGDNPLAVNKRKTHCKRGHEFTSLNTRTTTIGGRRCRTCAQADSVARRSARRKYMSPPEAAVLLGVTPSEVRDRCADGRINAVRSGRVWRIPIEEVSAGLAA
jgi:excisionase family DNA binding protein